MIEDVACPKCHRSNFRPYRLPYWPIIHWILNPWIAINEIILGQRIPKRMLICESCKLPYIERQYIPCPHCNTLNDARIWSCRFKYMFGNWLGLVCPACGEHIPCLWNITSLIIIGITSPLWYFPYHFYFRDRKTVKPILDTENLKTMVKIIENPLYKTGLPWSVFMWTINSFIPCLWGYLKTGYFDYHKMFFDGVIWFLGGLFFGTALHWMYYQEGDGHRKDP